MPLPPLFLLADDDVDDQEFFLEALREIHKDIRCVVANDGIEALEMLQADPLLVPDLIFLDQNMPKMNGLQCLRQIKEIETLKNVPVIMYSTSTHITRDREEAEKLGVSDFFKKTPSFRELVKYLEQVINSHHSGESH